MIKPKEIETKVFSTKMRGYNKREVDEFLDEVMIDYQALLDENDRLNAALAKVNKQIEENKENEKSVMRTLEQAKSLMSDISASAEKRAEAIIKNAQASADNITRNAQDSVEGANKETEIIHQKIAEFKLRFREMMTKEIERIEAESDDLFDELKSDFYPEAEEKAAGTGYTKVFSEKEALTAAAAATGAAAGGAAVSRDSVTAEIEDLAEESAKAVPERAADVEELLGDIAPAKEPLISEAEQKLNEIYEESIPKGLDETLVIPRDALKDLEKAEKEQIEKAAQAQETDFLSDLDESFRPFDGSKTIVVEDGDEAQDVLSRETRIW